MWKLFQFVETMIETDYPSNELQFPFMGILKKLWCGPDVWLNIDRNNKFKQVPR